MANVRWVTKLWPDRSVEVLDGEMVVPRPDGTCDFWTLSKDRSRLKFLGARPWRRHKQLFHAAVIYRIGRRTCWASQT